MSFEHDRTAFKLDMMGLSGISVQKYFVEVGLKPNQVGEESMLLIF